MFGKTSVDFDLLGLSNLKFMGDDPVGYIYNAVNFLKCKNPEMREADVCDRLFENVRPELKYYFIRDTPRTINDLIGRARDLAREIKCVKIAIMAGNPSITLKQADTCGGYNGYQNSLAQGMLTHNFLLNHSQIA